MYAISWVHRRSGASLMKFKGFGERGGLTQSRLGAGAAPLQVVAGPGAPGRYGAPGQVRQS
jgi:hypothetical protein